MNRFAIPALRAVRQSRTITPTPLLRRSPIASTIRIQTHFLQSRGYAAGGGLSHEEITGRVMEIMKQFEKVDQKKVSTSIIDKKKI
jgi:hypothetical protein